MSSSLLLIARHSLGAAETLAAESVVHQKSNLSTMSSSQSAEASRAAQKEARTLISNSIDTHGRAPAFLRLALHDALTWDAATRTGGANGSIRWLAWLHGCLEISCAVRYSSIPMLSWC